MLFSVPNHKKAVICLKKKVLGKIHSGMSYSPVNGINNIVHIGKGRGNSPVCV